ncbi:MAG: cysteine hydrolase [Deferrisomatales bacterium]|nr:cysteine hydrolase [Deferrisomatales bacterium]
MKPALIVVDMIKDNVGMHLSRRASSEFVKIIPPLQSVLGECRRRKIPVVFANDSFLEGDLLFSGQMKPHAIRGTEGVEVIPELGPESSDTVLEKRRMSAFFKTDLDLTLRLWQIDTILVAGIATHGCVYLTAMDGFAHDFRVVILEDCCAAHRAEIHEAFLGMMRAHPLEPIVRVMKQEELFELADVPPRI